MGRQAEETGRKNASVEFHPAQFRTSGYGEAPSGRPGAGGRAIDQRDQAIGIDEVLWHKGYQFLTVVYQIDQRVHRLLWVGQDRKAKTLLRFFRVFGPERSARLRFIAPTCGSPTSR